MKIGHEFYEYQIHLHFSNNSQLILYYYVTHLKIIKIIMYSIFPLIKTKLNKQIIKISEIK